MCTKPGEKNTCEGDSGGPLQIVGDHKKIATIVGITSTGLLCDYIKAPAVYTKVAYFLDWIEKIVWPDLH